MTQGNTQAIQFPKQDDWLLSGWFCKSACQCCLWLDRARLPELLFSSVLAIQLVGGPVWLPESTNDPLLLIILIYVQNISYVNCVQNHSPILLFLHLQEQFIQCIFNSVYNPVSSGAGTAQPIARRGQIFHASC